MALKIDKQRQKKVLVEQKELDGPEVERLEYLLGWRIEAVKRESRPCPRLSCIFLVAAIGSHELIFFLHSRSGLATTIWNRFTQIDPNDPEREFSLLIDFSDGDRYAGTPLFLLFPLSYYTTDSQPTRHFTCHCSTEMFAPVERATRPCRAAEQRSGPVYVHQTRSVPVAPL
jgi:hypothetical protein